MLDTPSVLFVCVHQTPKVLTTDAVQASDVVITMGCGDACPIFPGKRYLDWNLADPAGQGVAAVRPIREEIRARVEHLLTELTATTTPLTHAGLGQARRGGPLGPTHPVTSGLLSTRLRLRGDN